MKPNVATEVLSDDKVLLKKLTLADAAFFYSLYCRPGLAEPVGESPFLPNETPVQFTGRIISLCAYSWTIRPVRQPDLLIGDCALHHWNRDTHEIEIGGSLLPGYRGQGFMQAAFGLIIPVAGEALGVKTVLGSTNTGNLSAIRLVEKMGFVKSFAGADQTILRKVVGA
ncbi:MAG: GNAT family N-acetyltransferase [Cytophagales bacterium]|nr:GNAT family N-acetyltransferase [Cytophagales bacterium]